MHYYGAYSLPYGSYISKNVTTYEVCLWKECPQSTDNIWLTVMVCKLFIVVSSSRVHTAPRLEDSEVFPSIAGEKWPEIIDQGISCRWEQLKGTQDCWYTYYINQELEHFMATIPFFPRSMHCNVSRCFTYQTATYTRVATNTATCRYVGNIDRRFQSGLYM